MSYLYHKNLIMFDDNRILSGSEKERALASTHQFCKTINKVPEQYKYNGKTTQFATIGSLTHYGNPRINIF